MKTGCLFMSDLIGHAITASGKTAKINIKVKPVDLGYVWRDRTRWTETPPKKMGYYWAVRKGSKFPEMVILTRYEGIKTPHVLTMGYEMDYKVSEFDSWFLPRIEPPKGPNE